MLGSPRQDGGGPHRILSPLFVSWLLLAGVTSLPYLHAALLPPPGRAFVGTFHWIDDFHNYLSFVQQAEDGRFLFENKLQLEDRTGTLINLEWWGVGRLSRLLGGRPFLAYRLVALLALAGLLGASQRALRRLGVPASHQLPSLLLVLTAGGLGGLFFEFTSLPAARCLDLSLGLFPFVEALSNPHWLLGTWILLESLLALGGGRPRTGQAVLLGTILGLVRPYDFLLLCAILVASTLVTAPGREWPRRLLPLLALLPVGLYNYWVFYGSAAFSTFGGVYWMPPITDFIPALGPGLALAALGAGRSANGVERYLKVQLSIWILLALALIVLRPVGFSLQFGVGIGLPVLILAAVFLAGHLRPQVMLVVVLLCSSTSVVALRIVLRSERYWHVPSERLASALALREVCRSGQIAFSPADIGLYIMGRTSCRAYLSHDVAPAFAERRATVERFYTSASPAERTALLDRLGIDYLLLPGDPGLVPEPWLGSASPFRRLERVGQPPVFISVYGRMPGPGSTPSPEPR